MNDSRLKNIFGDTYTEDFFSSGSRFSQTLNEKGILIFKSFISLNGLKLLQSEANELKKYSYKSSSEYNVYISEHDNNFSKNSPRNRIMSTSKNSENLTGTIATPKTPTEVIKGFTSHVWKSKGGEPSPEPDKARYFPDTGVVLTYKMHGNNNPNNEVHAKVKISGKHFGPKTTMQKATFRVAGNTLVSTFMDLETGSSGIQVVEVLSLNDAGDEMTHSLFFSDNVWGRWICVPR